ncbi:hypothetical protein ABPG77_010438 [Micractinium sp. CCAP 211/92]
MWPLPLAAAVYLPMRGGLAAATLPHAAPVSEAAATKLVAQFHGRMGHEGICQLQLALFAEDLAAEGPAPLVMYPVNALRNRALQMATTEAVLCVDTDILVSTAFAAEVSSSQGWAALQWQLDGGAAVVLPAFETQHDVNGQLSLQEGRRLALEAALADKTRAMQRWHAEAKPLPALLTTMRTNSYLRSHAYL